MVALPVFLAGFYIHAFGVNVVFVDAWEVVPYFERLSQGSLTITDLWQQHNQNRSVFPRMTMLFLGTMTQWNTIVEMYVVLGGLAAAMICMFIVFVKEQRRRLIAPLAFLPAAFLLLSLRQSWNFLSGYQITFAFAQAFSIFALCLLYAGSRSSSPAAILTLPVAVACAVIASFSAIQGLLVWAAGTVLLLLVGGQRRYLGVWLLSGVFFVGAYFIGFTTNSKAPSILYPLTHPVEGLEYFFVLVGSSLVSPPASPLTVAVGATLTGLALVIVFLAVRERKLADNAFWISILLFSVLSLLAITAGRSGFGAERAVASRYTSLSLLGVASLYLMYARVWLDGNVRAIRLAFPVIVFLLVFSQLFAYSDGLKAGRASESQRQRAVAVLSTYEERTPQELRAVRTTNSDTIYRLAPVLERLGYSIFAASYEADPSEE